MEINTTMGMKRTNTQRRLSLQAPQLTTIHLTVIPAQEGIQGLHPTAPMAQHTTTDWIPA